MYLTHVKTLAQKATSLAFQAMPGDFGNTYVSLEYPVREHEYPSVWVNFDPTGYLTKMGVGHWEYADDDQGSRLIARWSFAGSISLTVTAMTSLERDSLFDAVVAMIAFGDVNTDLGVFRSTVENDPLVILQVNFDQIDQRGFAAAQGTPWGTDEMMYEATVSLTCIGEFISAPGTDLLLPISAIEVISWAEDVEEDPTTGPWLT